MFNIDILPELAQETGHCEVMEVPVQENENERVLGLIIII
jgi:hypothetical protein